MSDDWQVVESALAHAPPTTEVRRAFLALARLREREAQLKTPVWDRLAAQEVKRLEARVAELERERDHYRSNADWTAQEIRINGLVARVARLEEALREKDNQPLLNAARRLVLATDNAERNYALTDLVSALAHEEEA